MKNLNGDYYVEVKDQRYRIRPTEKIFLGKQDSSKSLGTQYQVQNDTQIRKNQKTVENNGKLENKIYPKNKEQPLNLQPKYKPPNCRSCKRNNWCEFDKDYCCQNCEKISTNRNIR